MLDAHQINVFLLAAETLSFTLAAQRLHMTQPSVSQHIHVLEQHFGMPLFIRSGRHLRLTDAGAALLPLAREMVSVSVHVEQTMGALKGDIHGQLMVGCSTTPGKYILPPLLAAFLRRHPQATANCNVTQRHMALQMLRDGAVHLALSSAREVCKDVEFRKFMIDPVLLIAPLNHPWARRECIEPEDLQHADFILREETAGTYSAAREGLAEIGIAIQQLRTVLTLGNSEAIALAVEEGIGVGFVSHLVESKLVHGRVARVRVQGLTMQQDIYLARHTRRAATAVQSAFWDFVHDPANEFVRRVNANGFKLAFEFPSSKKAG
ncbi:MAG TPA: LysR family transcriptional regulator [Anaerolineae bacterium]|nr:LysR family transcriptional regulator [Anaerolineae bacterium]